MLIAKQKSKPSLVVLDARMLLFKDQWVERNTHITYLPKYHMVVVNLEEFFEDFTKDKLKRLQSRDYNVPYSLRPTLNR